MHKIDWSYVIIWEFIVRPGNEQRFEQLYGADGEWAQFFRSGKGYRGTELNRDFKIPRRYLTLDFWASRQAYTQFRQANLAKYDAIDQSCECLTEREAEIGGFERI